MEQHEQGMEIGKHEAYIGKALVHFNWNLKIGR